MGETVIRKKFGLRFLIRETRRFFGEKSEKKKPKKVRNSFLGLLVKKGQRKKKEENEKKIQIRKEQLAFSLVSLFVRVFSTKTHTHLSLSYIYTHEYCLLKARVIYTHK